MVIVAGHITVDPERRESYLAGSVSVVDKARAAAGCLDFAAVKAFRRRVPRNKQCAAMRSASVAGYDIADARPLSRKGRA